MLVYTSLLYFSGDSATVRAATLIDHLSYYVRFHNEVFERRAEGIDRVTNANKTAEKTEFKALSSGKKGSAMKVASVYHTI